MKENVSYSPSAIAAALRSPARVAALDAAHPSFIGPDKDFDSIANLAAGLFAAPIALVSLLGRTDQWFLAKVGTPEIRAPSEDSFCARLIAGPDMPAIVVPDARLDPRFAQLPVVVGQPGLLFYAGAPVLFEGEAVGTVCVFDTKPHEDVDSVAALAQLERLAELTASLLRLKEEARLRALAADASLRDERRHAQALDAANVGSWLWNISSGSVVGNPALLDMLGLKAGGTLNARRIFSAIDPRDRKATLSRLRSALASGEEYDGLFRVVGTERWLLGRGRVHEKDASGRPAAFLGINIDVTDGQVAAQRTRLLLRELNHRVKNTLAMLQSLARQTLRQTRDPVEFMDAFAGRLQAISEAHGLLSDHEWGLIRLSQLLQTQIDPYVTDYLNRIEIHKDEVRLGPDQAIGLALVIHELTTNARRYGSLSSPTGKVVITARVMVEEDQHVLNMTWSETGGPPVDAPRQKGFGTILIERSLDKVLGSSVHVEYLPNGLTAVIRLPLDQQSDEFFA
jgi:PAS domain S-box-containing protein